MFRCRRRRRGIGESLESLHRKVDTNMGDLTKLNESVDRLLAGQSAAADEMAALRDEVANLQAGTITQEQIDSITTKVEEATTRLADSVNAPDGGVGGTGGTEQPPVEEQPPTEPPPAGGEAPPPGDEGGPQPGEDEPPAGDGGEPTPA